MELPESVEPTGPLEPAPTFSPEDQERIEKHYSTALLEKLAKFFTEGHAGYVSFTPAEVGFKLRQLATNPLLFESQVLSRSAVVELQHIRPDTRPKPEE